MSTRHKASDDTALYQQRYLSSPEFAQARGISGPAMASKVELLESPAQRSLVLFLQARSLAAGGVRRLAHEIIRAFPQRIGTPTMHALGMEKGQTYTAAKVDDIIEELADEDDCTEALLRRERMTNELLVTDADQESVAPAEDERSPEPWQNLYARCFKSAQKRLPDFLVEFCINPRIQFLAPGEKGSRYAEQQRIRVMREDLEADGDLDFESASVPYFRDIVGALFEFQQRYIESAREEFEQTTISKLVFESLEDAMVLGKIHVIEGLSRIGKTTAGEAWAKMHLGPVRFVKLNGFANKTTVLRKIAEALGIGSTHCHAPKDMEPLIFKVLQKTGIMLVIDEAHFLFSQGQRIYSRPEMIDWFDTELYNNGIPVVLIATPQFAKCLERAEVQVGWNADQFKGRVKRWKVLPETASRADLTAVAKKLLPGVREECIERIVGHALTSKRYMPALADAIDEARLLARKQGRDKVTFDDVERAIEEYVIPSEMAKSRTFEQPSKSRPAKGHSRPNNETLTPRSGGLNERGGKDFSVRDREQTPTTRRGTSPPSVVVPA